MRIIILTAFVLAALGTTLYQIKTSIDERQAELRMLQKTIAATQRDIALLEAEWAFLSRPDRMLSLSANLLDMKPISYDRILPLEAIPMRQQKKFQPLNEKACVTC